jgi:hypothetical protein
VPEREDRFGDLGPGEPAREGGAAERLAELDEAEAPPKPPPPRPSGRYSWVVGVAFLIAIAVGLINILRSEGPGAGSLDPGTRMPAFAAPLATGRIEGDANVKQEAGDPDSAGKVPACQVRGAGIMNVCDLWRKPLVLAFMFTRGANCEPQLDRMERVRSEFPGVNFAAVMVREPFDSARRIVREHGWGFPVAIDRDGIVSNLYGVGVCPTTTFGLRGGRVQRTRIGNLSEPKLRADVRALARGAK